MVTLSRDAEADALLAPFYKGRNGNPGTYCDTCMGLVNTKALDNKGFPQQ